LRQADFVAILWTRRPDAFEMKLNFATAMAVYAVLGCLAGFTLDGPLRIAVLLFLAALAVKTWIHQIRERQ
jgi:hypothetical protein